MASSRSPSPHKRGKDRRVQRTEHLLHDALSSLIREKEYDSIAVTEILDRANVGRSTFYAHFRDKDELLVSGIQDLLRGAGRAARALSAGNESDVLWFSRPIFEHLDAHRRAADASRVSGQAVVHGRLQETIEALVASELERGGGQRSVTCTTPTALRARVIAASFVLVLEWWMKSPHPLTPAQVDEQFRALVAPAVEAAQM